MGHAEFLDEGVVVSLMTVSATAEKDDGWKLKPTEPAVCLQPILLPLQKAEFRLVADSSERTDGSTKPLELAWPGVLSARYLVEEDAFDNSDDDTSLKPRVLSRYASNKVNTRSCHSPLAAAALSDTLWAAQRPRSHT